MASVRIENEAWGDPRYAVLANLCGLANPLFALILCARVWSHCTDRCDDVVSSQLLDALAGINGFADKLRDAELAEKVRGGYRIRGAKGRIEWLQAKRIAGKKGGDKKTENAKAQPKQEASTTSEVLEHNGGRGLVVPDSLPTLCSAPTLLCDPAEEEGRCRPEHRVDSYAVSASWHAALNAAGGMPGASHAEHAWRRDYETIAAAVNTLPEEQREVALHALCRWFWHAPDGPVQSGRVERRKANPGQLAKWIASDIAAAADWWRTRTPEAAQ